MNIDYEMLLFSVYLNITCIITLNEVHLKSSMFLFCTDIYTISYTDMLISLHQLITNLCGGINFMALVDLLKGIFGVEGVVVSLTANVSSAD